MKLFIIMIIITMSFGALHAQAYQLIEAKTGKKLSLQKMAGKLMKADVIFFGEYHDNDTIHQVQKELLPLLYKAKKKMIVSFEMFERDVQKDLDSYLEGGLSEEQFLERSRPWPNYSTDYKALLDFAKSKGLTVIAANVPRWIAGQVARASLASLEELSSEDKMNVAISIDASEGEYKQKFLATMQANGMHNGFGDEALYERLYQAQCVKDDTMAESIAQYKERFPKSTIIHFNGDFHSAGRLGTVERLKNRMPKLIIMVISPWNPDSKTVSVKEADYYIQLLDAEKEAYK